jgi:hypothetical protein
LVERWSLSPSQQWIERLAKPLVLRTVSNAVVGRLRSAIMTSWSEEVSAGNGMSEQIDGRQRMLWDTEGPTGPHGTTGVLVGNEPARADVERTFWWTGGVGKVELAYFIISLIIRPTEDFVYFAKGALILLDQSKISETSDISEPMRGCLLRATRNLLRSV